MINVENNANMPSILEINPSSPATAIIIWLHGLGATNEDFVSVAYDLERLTHLNIRFVFPQAPSMPVTINNGSIMPAWYDIHSFDQEGKIDHSGISASVHQIKILIENELKKGFPAKKIILAGFSQGAVIALSTLLSHPQSLGGVIALSGYLPHFTLPLAKHTIPIFIGHGIEDTVVPYYFGEMAFESLKNANYPVTWHTYAMPHTVSEEEIYDISQWLQKILA